MPHGAGASLHRRTPASRPLTHLRWWNTVHRACNPRRPLQAPPRALRILPIGTPRRGRPARPQGSVQARVEAHTAQRGPKVAMVDGVRPAQRRRLCLLGAGQGTRGAGHHRDSAKRGVITAATRRLKVSPGPLQEMSLPAVTAYPPVLAIGQLRLPGLRSRGCRHGPGHHRRLRNPATAGCKGIRPDSHSHDPRQCTQARLRCGSLGRPLLPQRA